MQIGARPPGTVQSLSSVQCEPTMCGGHSALLSTGQHVPRRFSYVTGQVPSARGGYMAPVGSRVTFAADGQVPASLVVGQHEFQRQEKLLGQLLFAPQCAAPFGSIGVEHARAVSASEAASQRSIRTNPRRQ